MQKCEELWKSRNFTEAYHEADRALRPVRILMRAHWEKAVRGLDTPVASPYAVTFYTLPRHWQFMNQVRACSTSANVLVGGDFELDPTRIQDSWKLVKESLDDVELTAQRTAEMSVDRIEEKKEEPKDIKPGVKVDAKITVKKVHDTPIEGRQCLMLQVKPHRGKVGAPGPGADGASPDESQRETAARKPGANQRPGQCPGADHRFPGRCTVVR